MRAVLALIGVLVLAATAQAQVVDSGSTGADGPFTATLLGSDRRVPPGTFFNCTGLPFFPDACTAFVPLREPPDHVFHFTTITVQAGVTVRFIRNAANTPVFMLATGDVTINGLIDVSGENGAAGISAARGGPGGFSGGTSIQGGVGGAGSGPGGGAGAYVQASGAVSPQAGCFADCYGNLQLLPLIGGSGGGGGLRASNGPPYYGNGGGGGGALLIASSRTIDLGTGSGAAIQAMGGAPEYRLGSGPGNGSGGAVRLVSNTLIGNRAIRAFGWQESGPGQVPVGGIGRIRLETPTGSALPYAGLTRPAATYNAQGQPIVIFPPIVPRLRIVSISGAALPAQPTVDAATPDVSFGPSLSGNAFVVVEATHVPSGTPVKVIVSPQFGAGGRSISGPTPLTGPAACATAPGEQCMHATVAVPIPAAGSGIISALIDAVTPVP